MAGRQLPWPAVVPQPVEGGALPLAAVQAKPEPKGALRLVQEALRLVQEALALAAPVALVRLGPAAVGR